MSELEQNPVVENEPEANTPSGPTVIKATNPTPEEMVALCENIQVNHDFQVDVKPVTFNFKKQKDKDTGLETIREHPMVQRPRSQ